MQQHRTAALWGFIVGDALGVPYEFTDRAIMKTYPATGMIGYGTHQQPVGTWSDDTSMMLCVILNIKKGGSVQDLANLFVQWLDEGYHTPWGSVFDVGITTYFSIEAIKSGVHVSRSGGYDEFSAGNGSLMRCLPYAFAEDFPKSMFTMIRENKITHRLEICNDCCLFYAKLNHAISQGFTKQQSLEAACAYLHFGRRIMESSEENDFTSLSKFSRLYSGNFQHLPEEDIKSTGYVVNTLEAAIWCFLNSESYYKAVLMAVNLGGDTDTIAALTGGMAGNFYGYQSIPIEWLNQIVRKNDLAKLIFNNGD